MPARSRSRSRSRSRGMMGGDASDWVTKNFGTSNQQWSNTFGPNSLGVNTGNLLPTVSGAPAVLPGMTPQGINSPSQLIPLKNFNGGRRRRGRKGTKRGGMGMLAQAAVPLTLLALQQSYGTRRRSSRRGSRRRRSSRRR